MTSFDLFYVLCFPINRPTVTGVVTPSINTDKDCPKEVEPLAFSKAEPQFPHVEKA